VLLHRQDGYYLSARPYGRAFSFARRAGYRFVKQRCSVKSAFACGVFIFINNQWFNDSACVDKIGRI
jgi:hypothetical protein